MKVFNRIMAVILSILFIGGPQLNNVDAIEISNKSKVDLFQDMNL